MSEQEQDLTSNVQELMVQMVQMKAELASLKERAQALPQVERELPASPVSSITSTRRKTLKKLGLALLGGAVAATAVGGTPAQAKIIANPATGSASKIGTVVILPGVNNPTGTAPDGYSYGLVVSSENLTLSLDSLPSDDIGIYGKSFNYGVYGTGTTGVYGTGFYGVYGFSSHYGVYGNSGSVSGNYAGYFYGNVFVSGTLSKPAGSFKVDHPLDPANKYLYHSFVESPDMMNIYNGIVTLDNQGEATVEMPDWFEALNSDFRYQLTCLGQYSQVYIAKEMKERKFRIAGGLSGQRVSWQVTGIRQDAYAKAHRIPVEEDKNDKEKGKYIHPKLFGQPEEMSVHPRPVAAK